VLILVKYHKYDCLDMTPLLWYCHLSQRLWWPT